MNRNDLADRILWHYAEADRCDACEAHRLAAWHRSKAAELASRIV